MTSSDSALSMLSSFSPFGELAFPRQLLAVSVVVLLFWFALAPSRVHRAVAHLPRPPSALPFVGNLKELLNHHATLHTLFYGECLRFDGRPFVVSMPTKLLVVLSTVEAMEDVLKTHFDKFGKGKKFAETMRDVFGHDIFVTDGAKWQQQRKTANHLFSMRAMRDTMDSVMKGHTQQLYEILAKAAKTNEVVDIKRLLELYGTGVFTTIGFGVDLEFMTSDANLQFFDTLRRANQIILERQELPTAMWKLKRWLGIGSEGQNKLDMAWLDKFMYQLIQDSMTRKKRQDNGDHKPISTVPVMKDLVTLCLENTASSPGGDLNVTEIRDMAVSFISSGRDTTSTAMTWFLIMLATFPAVQQRVRQELWDSFPGLSTGEITVPTREQTAELVYLEAAIRENLRLNQVLPLNTREALKDVTLSDGTFLAAGTEVLLPTYAMARLPSVWGDDATEFKPERWLDSETGKLLVVSPFKFMAFNAGPRICPGLQFSMVEMKIALAMLLGNFYFATTKSPDAFTYEMSLTLDIHGPVFIRPAFATVRSQ